ncbi:4-hydroxythreonine-4-phosphate dehydrogenase PdxA [Pseudoroseomonas cervicalis]|uniref:4-hydroxythreonine-4-phosphate dehydrogenase PdxA n=1 Tax=Teichococcus cervicalis TaxID=204525 RepID=UPI0022F19A28|nr:4-hydroxythreonine-4-phosphate dehydrogenase PdxA [Pseudoroseomonas cervicalis]WBV45411.1 4-hydroxythreonine-4-phosphate dehydrogenase PdxA [Pseudoroseomonas cervicalis]
MTLPLILTMGEPSGIGGEIAAAAWRALRGTGPCFLYLGDPSLLGDTPWRAVDRPEQAAEAFATALPVLPLRLAAPARPGQPDPRNAAAVIEAIRQGVARVQAGQGSALVTNPIQKSVLTAAGFRHPGHTEFLAELAPGGGPPVMLLAAAGLRTVPVTIHQSLRSAIEDLTPELILRIARATAEGLRRDFGIAAPRLALCGLNPHAGEDGTMGHEDRDIIAPAIATLRAEGIDARGPYPSDTLFTPQARQGYDVALGMYHDQALIPVKTLDMAGGVNVTLGLSIIRTSPDHGTALDIAGQRRADPGSLVAALRLAAELATHRQQRSAA